MPQYDGRSITAGTVRILSAKSNPNMSKNYDSTANPGVRVQDGYMGNEGNVRVANRHVLITTLMKSLKFETKINCFDVNLASNIILIAGGRVVYVVNLESNVLKADMGKSGGSSHKEDIRGCCIDLQGKYGATCGDDKRVIVWDLTNYKASKIIEAHQGAVHQVEFTADSEKLIASSDDGRVLIWDWRSSTLISSIMRHPSAVRTFDFNYTKPDLIICGCNDGRVAAWNLNQNVKFDEILPETELIALGMESNATNAPSSDTHHFGSILHVKLSVDRQLMATCSSDDTCKIWKIDSYQKDNSEVTQALLETEELSQKLNGMIDVLDETFDSQLTFTERQTLKIGDLPIHSGYHADLKFTLNHEAPVTCAAFSKNSDLVITGSLDSTVRIWSSRRGDPLFQINIPDAVQSIKLDYKDTLYVSSINRILVFSVKPMFKEQELPNYWMKNEMKKKMAQLNRDGTPAEGGVERSDESSIPLSELRKLIAHGVVLPDAIDQIGSSITDFDMKQLMLNMKKFNIFPQQILRLIAQSKFLPRDILRVLSSKNPQTVMSLLAQGASITMFMLQRGYKMLGMDEDPNVTINLKNLTRPDELRGRRNHKTKDFDYEEWWNLHFDGGGEYMSDDEDDQFLWQNDRPRDYQAPRGRIVHFIPSEHMKILKDLQSNRDVKPIFLRSIAAGKHKDDDELYPNFKLGENVPPDTRPALKKPNNNQSVRFNEQVNTKGKARKPKSKLTQKLNNVARPELLQDIVSPDLLKNMALHGNLLADSSNQTSGRRLKPKSGWGNSDTQDFDLSREVLKPFRYLQTRGLNVSYGAESSQKPDTIQEDEGRELDSMIEAVFTTPLAFGGNQRARYSVPLSTKQKQSESFNIGSSTNPKDPKGKRPA